MPDALLPVLPSQPATGHLERRPPQDTRLRKTDRREGLTAAEKLEVFSIPEPNSGCLLWTKAVNGWGYGRTWADGKVHSVHRLAWETGRGPIPEGMCVCHKCDVPSCVNVDHLFLGTCLDNVRDMHAKRRNGQVNGEDHPGAKITAPDAAAIIASSESTLVLATRYGLTPGRIRQIKRGEGWATVTEATR